MKTTKRECRYLYGDRCEEKDTCKRCNRKQVSFSISNLYYAFLTASFIFLTYS